MNRASARAAVLYLCLLLMIAFAPASLAAPNIGAAPGSIDRFHTGAVEITVSGLLGPDLHLRLLVDVNGNGVADVGDTPIWSGVIVDNGTPWSPVMPADTDATVGTVVVDMRLMHPFGFPYSAGSFLWEAEDPSDASTGVAGLDVVQTVESQSISGQVTTVGMGTPVGGALVVLLPMSEDCEEYLLGAFTDASGNYLIQVPDDIACSNRLVLPVKPGFLFEFFDASPFEFTGSDAFSGVDLELSPASEVATGTLRYGSGPLVGQGIPGTMLFADSETGLSTVGFTDIDGSYAVGVEDGEWSVETDSAIHLALQGAVEEEDTGAAFTVAGGPAGIPDITAPAANAFVRGTLLDDALGPLAGRLVEADSQYPCTATCQFAETVTASDGSFVFGFNAPADPQTADFEFQPTVPAEGLVAEVRTVSLSDGDDLLGQDLEHLAPTAFVSGTVTEIDGSPVGDVCLWGNLFGPTLYASRAKVDCDGSYLLPVIDGNWNVRFREDDLVGLFRGLDTTPIDRQVAILGADESLDLVLGRASFLPTIVTVDPPAASPGSHVLIEGTNLGGNPDPIVTFNGTPVSIVASRPDFGRLVVEVPAGQPPGPVTVQVDNAESGLSSNPGCLEILGAAFTPTCSITGNLTRAAGTAPVNGGLVVALDETTQTFTRMAVSDAAGNYVLDLEDAATSYSLIVIPSLSPTQIWGEYGGVSCPAAQDHDFVRGSAVFGRVVDPSGEGVPNVVVSGSSPTSSSDILTNDTGGYALRFNNGDTVGLDFRAPNGSRFINDQTRQATVMGSTALPTVQLSAGSIFAGHVLEIDGSGSAALVQAFPASPGGNRIGGSGGWTRAQSCSGAFGIALSNNLYSLSLRPAGTNAETRVEWVEVDGDAQAEFDFIVADESPLQFDGPEPRINNDLDPRGAVGQPVTFGIENLAETGVEAFFATGSKSVAGSPLGAGVGTVWDPVRGILLTRVPPTATSGDLVVTVEGVDSAAFPFTVETGPWDPGTLTLAGTVAHLSDPVEDALVLLLRDDPNDSDCDGDSIIHDYVVTDLSGTFSLTHPGGDVFLAVLPPRAVAPVKGTVTPTDLAPIALEFLNETADRIGVSVDLVTGAPLTLRVAGGSTPPPKSAAGAPLPGVPNVTVTADSDVFDRAMTDADGFATLWLPPGPVELEIIPPFGSRYVEALVPGIVPEDLGDVVLEPGVLIGGRFADVDSNPVFGAFAEASSQPFKGFGSTFLFESVTRQDGLWRGAVLPGVPLDGGIDSERFDLSDVFFDYRSGVGQDLIRYPSDVSFPAGSVEGTIFDSDSMAPLPFTGISASADQGGGIGTPAGFARTCDDGTYRIKLAEGAYFVGAFPDGYLSDQLEGWYSPATGPGDFCSDDAEAILVAGGATVSGADIGLDYRSNIQGNVRNFGMPEDGLNVNVTGSRLGSCRIDAFTDGGGNYFADVPAATGYRVEADAPPSLLLPPQCFDGEDGCGTFTPVSTQPVTTTSGIDFHFGFAPPEISETVQPLGVDKTGGGFVTLIFEARPPQDRADFYNIYEGSLGDFGSAVDAQCFLDPFSFFDNGNGSYSDSFFADTTAGWFLVGASNGFAEGSIGDGRMLSNACGPSVPPPSTASE